MKRIIALVMAFTLLVQQGAMAQGLTGAEKHPVLNPQYMNGFMQEKKNFQQIFEENKDNWDAFLLGEQRETYEWEKVMLFFKELASDYSKRAEFQQGVSALDREVSDLLAEHEAIYDTFIKEEEISHNEALRETRKEMYLRHSQHAVKKADRHFENWVLTAITGAFVIGGVLTGCLPAVLLGGGSCVAACGGMLYDTNYMENKDIHRYYGELNNLNRRDYSCGERAAAFLEEPGSVLLPEEPVTPYNLYEMLAFGKPNYKVREYYADFLYVTESLSKYGFPEWKVYKIVKKSDWSEESFPSAFVLPALADAYRELDAEVNVAREQNEQADENRQ